MITWSRISPAFAIALLCAPLAVAAPRTPHTSHLAPRTSHTSHLAHAPRTSHRAPRTSTDRIVLNFNPDWRFIKADPPGASEVSFDDRTWTPVSTPHTFNDIDTFDNWST